MVIEMPILNDGWVLNLRGHGQEPIRFLFTEDPYIADHEKWYRENADSPMWAVYWENMERELADTKSYNLEEDMSQEDRLANMLREIADSVEDYAADKEKADENSIKDRRDLIELARIYQKDYHTKKNSFENNLPYHMRNLKMLFESYNQIVESNKKYTELMDRLTGEVCDECI